MRSLRHSIFWGVGAWLGLWQLRVLFAPDLEVGPLFSRFAHDVALLVAAALCLWAALAHRRERTAWLLIGTGMLAWSLGEVWYTAVLWTAEEIPVPSPADIGYLAFPPLAGAGLVVLLREPLRRAPKTLWVDGVIAALSVAAVSAAIVVEAVAARVSGQPVAVFVSLAYPVLDLALIALVVGAVAATGWRLERTLLLLGLGVGAFWLADSLYLVAVANGTYTSGSWFDMGWWLGMFLIAAAAWQHRDRAAHGEGGAGVRLIAIPLSFGAAGLGLLVYGCLARVNVLAVALAAASLLAVMVRLVLTFRENQRMLTTSREEALTDALTGLGNRRALTRALVRALERAGSEAGEPLVLVLFDLDGFKHYNDTFGHPAGDALLQRLGRNLDAHVGDRGRAFRMGGDEFCALLAHDGDDPEPLASSAAAALVERGEGFAIDCSWGAVLLPQEAGNVHDALRVADQRMYAQKNAGRVSASRQSKDVLLRALAERNPDLSSHLFGVADLAEATARILGLRADEVEQVRHAAELHDVGKVAIPDEILGKPGPLESGEWDFIHRHTVIGERIVAAAPALIPVAVLVRSTHERWDGQGYPDRLGGEEIPLGSRIVAVADAFDAMTSVRPYSRPRDPEDALAELRRCAGTQFDPAVVAAFCAAWDERTATRSAAA